MKFELKAMTTREKVDAVVDLVRDGVMTMDEGVEALSTDPDLKQAFTNYFDQWGRSIARLERSS